MISLISNPKGTTLNKLLKTLKNEGIFVVNSYLDKPTLSEIRNEVLNCHSTFGSQYDFGSSYSIKSPFNFKNCEKQVSLFKENWIKELFIAYNNKISKGFCDSIYSTHDYKFDGNIARNGYLHFDRNSSLKFFIYLDDVNKENGAFFIQPNSHKLGKELREKAWGKMIPKPNDNLLKKVVKKLFGKNFSVVKNRIELDYPELYDSSKLIPVEGKAGTLIVFDSDIFHLGGLIEKKGLERLVLRMHSYMSK